MAQDLKLKMNRQEFEKEYNAILKRALSISDRARKEGIIAIADDVDEEKYLKRDVFELGLKLIADGTAGEIISGVLTNIVEQETDREERLLATVKREAVYAIFAGYDSRITGLMLNSLVDVGIEEAMKAYAEAAAP
jgi:flagellar motor component MotA